jgi:hypothetical protein
MSTREEKYEAFKEKMLKDTTPSFRAGFEAFLKRKSECPCQRKK